MKSDKPRYGGKIIYVGLVGESPTSTNGMWLGISLPAEKAQKRIDIIESHIAAESITFNQLGNVIGKLGFAQTHVFNKFARCMVQPLYRKLYLGEFNPFFYAHRI